MGDVISSSVIPSNVFAFVVGVPSIILYSLEVFILLKRHKRYNSAFFGLFIVRFSLNFLGYFNLFIYARLGRLGVFRDFFEILPSKLLAFSFFFIYYTFHAENLATMFILINRLSLMAMPMNHEKIWKYLLTVSITCVFVLPLFVTAQNLSYEFYVRHTLGSTTQFTLDFRKHEGEQYMRSTYAAAISAILFCIVCGAINILIIILYQKRKKIEITLRQKNKQNMETKLTIYAFTTFLSHALMAVYMILIYIGGSDLSRDMLFFSAFNQLPWLSDLGTIVIPAWMLLWACSSIRQEVMTMVGLKKHSPQESVFQKVNNNKNVTVTSVNKITMKI